MPLGFRHLFLSIRYTSQKLPPRLVLGSPDPQRNALAITPQVHFVAMPGEEIRTLLITSATYFLPDSRYKHSEFSQKNPTLGEFCFAMLWYARESVAQESYLHFHCYTITHSALVRVDLRTCRALVHGLTTRPWKPTIQFGSYGYLM